MKNPFNPLKELIYNISYYINDNFIFKYKEYTVFSLNKNLISIIELFYDGFDVAIVKMIEDTCGYKLNKNNLKNIFIKSIERYLKDCCLERGKTIKDINKETEFKDIKQITNYILNLSFKYNIERNVEFNYVLFYFLDVLLEFCGLKDFGNKNNIKYNENLLYNVFLNKLLKLYNIKHKLNKNLNKKTRVYKNTKIYNLQASLKNQKNNLKLGTKNINDDISDGINFAKFYNNKSKTINELNNIDKNSKEFKSIFKAIVSDFKQKFKIVFTNVREFMKQTSKILLLNQAVKLMAHSLTFSDRMDRTKKVRKHIEIKEIVNKTIIKNRVTKNSLSSAKSSKLDIFPQSQTPSKQKNNNGIIQTKAQSISEPNIFGNKQETKRDIDNNLERDNKNLSTTDYNTESNSNKVSSGPDYDPKDPNRPKSAKMGIPPEIHEDRDFDANKNSKREVHNIDLMIN